MIIVGVKGQTDTSVVTGLLWNERYGSSLWGLQRGFSPLLNGVVVFNEGSASMHRSGVAPLDYMDRPTNILSFIIRGCPLLWLCEVSLCCSTVGVRTSNTSGF